MAKADPANPASEAWSTPDPKGLTERGRYEALVRLLDGSKAQTRRAVVRWVVAAELDDARCAYREASDDGEVYKAKLLRLSGVSTKRAAEVMAEHLHGVDLALDVVKLAMQVATSTETAGSVLVDVLDQLHTLAGPWKDARAGAEHGHGIASLDDKPERVARLREEARLLHERWTAKQAQANAKKSG